MKKNIWMILGAIFLLALMVRFYAFRESVYFGFDNARDAYISQDIYSKGDLKLIGPPVSGDIGLFHGPLYWYLIGPIFLLFKGDPAMVSAVFRVFNALGIYLVYGVSSLLFTPLVGIVSALLFAVSFEESQYAIYVGNPGLGVLTVLIIFFGATLIYKKGNNSKWGPLLMFSGAAISTQMNLMFVYTFFIVLTLLVLLNKQAALIAKRFWILGLTTAGLIMSTYLLVEIKYGFRSVKLAENLLSQGYGVMDHNASKYQLFLYKFLTMFKDNLTGVDVALISTIIALFMTIWVLVHAVKSKPYQILAVWLFGWIFLMFLGGHTAYYTNAGLGVAVLIGAALLIERLAKYNQLLAGIIYLLIIVGNVRVIWYQSPRSLIHEFIVQPMMKLSDEYKIIDQMYMEADGKGFTVRITGIPYRIQTVWSYLFHFYGLPKYGYLPLWEAGNVLGFPGEMPTPKKGTNCLRFLGREPTRGLPQVVVDYDIKLENEFSIPLKKISIGDFTLETRQAIDLNCHNDRS